MFHSVSLIADVLISLQQHGNDQYMGWQMKFQCNTHNIVHELQNMASKMEKDLTEWKDEVKGMRKEFYQLNYFTTQQLLQLRKELGRFKNPNVRGSVKPQVVALLQCISHDITSDIVIEQVHIATAILKEQSMAEKQYSQEKVIPVATGIADIITQDMSNTAEPILSEHVPKLSLATSGPQPTLREDELTDKQRSIVDNLKESAGFHRKLVMFAFERCAKPDMEEEVEAWCNEHEDEFDFTDSDAVTSSSDELSSLNENISYMEEEFEGPDVQIQQKEANVLPDIVEHKIPIGPKVRVVERKPIDENHEVVKDLLLAGYELQECIEAANMYPDDSEQAMLYLESSGHDYGEAHEGMFHKAISLSSTYVTPQPLGNLAYEGMVEHPIYNDPYDRQDSKDSVR